MLVLEGPQGKMKSEALRTLAIKDSWFTDRLSHVASKDAAIEIAGVLLAEIAEMDALSRASSSSTKSFLTRRHDRFRPPFGKHIGSWPRQCVFAGTINPIAGGYLKDPTGARRIWPVACHGMIDRDGIERDRDHLGPKPSRATRAMPSGGSRRPNWKRSPVSSRWRASRSTWKAPIEKWLGPRKKTSIEEVLRDALKLAPEELTQNAQTRAAHILTHLGFTKHRPRKGAKRQNEYWRE